MTWGETSWLVGLWLLPVLAVLVWLTLRRRAQALALLGP